MSSRATDWLRQARGDLAHARRSLEVGAFDWACFIAQQAAEKAAKAVHQARGQVAWGHAATGLLEALAGTLDGVDDALLERARRLDKYYVVARYPNGFPAGAPVDLVTRGEAEQSVADAEAIVGLCARGLP